MSLYISNENLTKQEIDLVQKAVDDLPEFLTLGFSSPQEKKEYLMCEECGNLYHKVIGIRWDELVDTGEVLLEAVLECSCHSGYMSVPIPRDGLHDRFKPPTHESKMIRIIDETPLVSYNNNENRIQS